jgi:hypothetical protein
LNIANGFFKVGKQLDFRLEHECRLVVSSSAACKGGLKVSFGPKFKFTVPEAFLENSWADDIPRGLLPVGATCFCPHEDQ